MMQKQAIIFLFSCVICVALVARESELVEQAKIGNLAVDSTMQPVPFLGFGENIISQYELLGGVTTSWLGGNKQHFIDVFPYILYGVRDDFSILLSFPTAVSYKQDGYHSSGASDILLQFEYAFYEAQTKTSSNELTVVGSIFLPTGNECKIPATGLGSVGFFLGITASHLDVEWYGYTSYGAFIRTKLDNNTKIGNRFLYEAGIGKNIAYQSEKWMLMWMVEFLGIYDQKSKINGIIDESSAANQILIGPSVWFSTQRLILHGGIAPIVLQHYSGVQPKKSFYAELSVIYRFT